MVSSNMKKKNYIHNIAKEITMELTEESSFDTSGINIEALTRMIDEYNIARYDNNEYTSMREIIPKIISTNNINQSFAIIDIGALIRRYRLWMKFLPNIEIFYAVKCNSDPIIIKTLANLGVGFDVASKGEINIVKDMEISSDRIIYANPCKGPDHIKYARSQNVRMMTFDNENELLKISLNHPKAKLILRILVDDITNSKMKFGCKFGCPLSDVSSVLGFGKFHKLDIIGVSFHVGSACLDPKSYSNSIKRAKEVFDIAKSFGYEFTMLDIGGGFPGSTNNDDETENGENYDIYDDGQTSNTNDTNDSIKHSGDDTFREICQEIQSELQNSFSDVENLRVIAEPGRFFATSALTFVASVTCKKSINYIKKSDIEINDEKKDENNDEKKENNNEKNNDENERTKIFHYYIDSSLYSMFNNKIFDHAVINLKVLNNYDDDSETYPSVIFGETCDSMDEIARGIQLPELACGDYLYVEDHGAYTIASSSAFNGFPIQKPLYIFTF
jgi:diaminopimelate decarboxylase